MDNLIEENQKKSKILLFSFPALILFTIELVVVILLSWMTKGSGFSVFSNLFLAVQPVSLIILLISTIYVLVKVRNMNSILDNFPGAHEMLDHEECPVLDDVIEELCVLAGIPKPRIFIIETDELNAFSIGKDPGHASLGVTVGLLEHMNRNELSGVIGHEIGHLINRDTSLMGVTISICSLLALMGTMSYFLMRITFWGNSNKKSINGFFSLVAIVSLIVIYVVALPLSKLLRANLSRQREYLADETSADLTKNPNDIIDALEVLKGSNTTIAPGKPVMAMCIAGSDDGDDKESEKTSKKASSFMKMFSLDDHPPLQDRIERLKKFYE